MCSFKACELAHCDIVTDVITSQCQSKKAPSSKCIFIVHGCNTGNLPRVHVGAASKGSHSATWKHHPAALTSLNHQGGGHFKNGDDHDNEGDEDDNYDSENNFDDYATANVAEDDDEEVKDVHDEQARGEVVELGGLPDAEPALKVKINTIT